MLDELRRVALVGSGVFDLTRQRAEQIVRDLVKSGDVRRDQTSGLVKELLKRSAENRKDLTRFVRSELKSQIEGLGLATKRDLERLERRIARLEDARKAERKAATAKKTTAKKTTAKKTTAKKTSAPAKETTPVGPKSPGGDPGATQTENRATETGEG